MTNVPVILTVAIASVVCYLAATVLRLFSLQKASNVCWLVGVAGNLLLVVNNWWINGYVPFISMYQVLTFLALLFAPIYLYMKYWHRESWMAVYFMAAPAICLIGVCCMGVGTVWNRAPALQSVWFIPHILFYMIAYTLCTVAFLMTLISLFRKKDRPRLETGAFTLIQTAYPFMTGGMFMGAIWANAVWGAFWSFDAKENWSLVTWLVFGLFLHFWRTAHLKKACRILAILGFVCIVITMVFVNFMGGASYHTYSST